MRESCLGRTDAPAVGWVNTLNYMEGFKAAGIFRATVFIQVDPVMDNRDACCGDRKACYQIIPQGLADGDDVVRNRLEDSFRDPGSER